MELRQLKYFVSVIEAGSFSGAAQRQAVGVSALSQQISRLEDELATRLLQRTSRGVQPTGAGLAFFHQAQLALRHASNAVKAAQRARLSGHVSVGMAPSTASVLGLPFIHAMRERYTDVRLHVVESLSGNLAAQIATRQLDLGILFQQAPTCSWSAIPVLEETLFVIGRHELLADHQGKEIAAEELHRLPLILPSAGHGLRALVERLCAWQQHALSSVIDIDGLAVLMDTVRDGLGVTIQPGAAVSRLHDEQLRVLALHAPAPGRVNLLVSLNDDGLSPAGIAARVVLQDVMTRLVADDHWPAMTWLTAAQDFIRMTLVLLWFSFFFGMYNGAMVAALTEIMPVYVRTVGFSLAFSLATAVFGGLTPVISTALVEFTDSRSAPAWWLMCAALCGLAATCALFLRVSGTQEEGVTVSR